MSSLTPFRFDSHAVRVIEVAGEPWFVAKDVALALDYSWTGTQRIEHVPEEWRGITSVVTPYGAQEMAVLSEQGLYFFIGRSDKPKALPFQKWLAGEVLPAIRRTGEYRVTPDSLSADLTRLQSQLAACHAELLKVHPLWRKVTRYRRMGLNHTEVGLLVDRSRSAASRQAHRIEACGILTPPEPAQLSLLEG